MKIEDQVVSLELAKRLTGLGVDAPSLFSWMEHGEGPATLEIRKNEVTPYTYEYPAFTVAELGELLPPGVISMVGSWAGDHKNWVCEWWRTEEWNMGKDKFSDSEANARAKMLIHLLENKLVLP